MNELKKTVTTNSGGSLRTLHQCLVALGADPEEVYSPKSLGHNNKYPQNHPRLREKFWNTSELKAYAEYLWKRAMRQAHPDVGGDKELACRLNQAYDRLLHIISYWA